MCFIQNSTKLLESKIASIECFESFRSEENAPEQLIIINKDKFPGEKFTKVNIEEERKRIIGEQER